MRPMVLLFIALFNSILGLSVLFPVLAPLGRDLGLSDFQITSLSTAYALMQVVFGPYWGRQSEKRGRKPILLVGILGFAAAFFLFAAVAHAGLAGWISGFSVYGLLLLSRLLGGTLSSATIPTAQAYAADISDRDNRTSAMAVIGAAFGLGVIFGPAIGVGLSQLTGSLLAPVYFSAGVAIVNAFFVHLRLPEPERHREEAAVPSRSTSELARKAWPLLAVGLATSLASVAMEQTLAFYFQDRLHLDSGGTVRAVGLALVGYGLVAVFTQGFLVRRFKWKPLTLLRGGLPLGIAGFGLFVIAGDYNYGGLIIALLLQGAGQGLIMPGVTAALSLTVGDSEQGPIAGLNSSAQGMGRALGPVLGGGLYQWLRPEAPYAFSAVLLMAVFVAVLLRPSVADAAPPTVKEVT